MTFGGPTIPLVMVALMTTRRFLRSPPDGACFNASCDVPPAQHTGHARFLVRWLVRLLAGRLEQAPDLLPHHLRAL